MKTIFVILKKQKLKIMICGLLVLLQTAAAFALPALTGDLISVGVQQQGTDSAYPVIMGENTRELLARILPAEEYSFFMNAYEPDEGGVFRIKSNADTDKLTVIFRGAIVAGARMADNGKEISSFDLKIAADFASIKLLNRKTKGIVLGENEKAALYRAAEGYAEGPADQLARVAVAFVYDDAGVNVEKTKDDYCRRCFIKMFICLGVELLSALAAAYLAASVSSAVQVSAGRQVAEKIASFTKKELGGFTPGELCEASSASVEHIGALTDYGLRTVLYVFFASVTGTVLSFRISPFFGAGIILISLSVLIVAFIVYKPVNRRYGKLIEYSSGYYDLSHRFISKAVAIRSARSERSGIKKARELSEKTGKEEKFVLSFILSGLNLLTLITGIAVAATVFFSSDRLLDAPVGLGGVIKFVQYAALTLTAFLMLGAVALFAPNMIASFKTIAGILDAENPVIGGDARQSSGKWDVEYRDVVCGGMKVSFTAPAGKVTAITGKSGCGKTTILNYLNRFDEPVSGDIFVAGRNVKDYAIDFLCGEVARFDSSPAIVTGSVSKNVTGTENADRDKLCSALALACCDFIAPYDTVVNDGCNLSGGQKSRIALARAFAMKRGVYVFDDCMTALDSKTENTVFCNIRDNLQDSALIFVTQSAEILAAADNVVVMDGKSCISGTHKEMLAVSEYYKGLFDGRVREGEKREQ